MSENSGVKGASPGSPTVPSDRQVKVFTLRCTLEQYAEISTKASQAGLSANSWILSRLGFPVPEGAKKGRRLRMAKPPQPAVEPYSGASHVS